MSPRHPFKRSKNSPYDESGPNSTALRRHLDWLQTRGREAPPVSVAKEPESTDEPPVQTEEIPTEDQPKEQIEPEEAAEAPTEPPPENEPAAIEAAPETPIPQEENAQPEPAEPETQIPTEFPSAELDLELVNLLEEARAEAAAIGETNPRTDYLDARRFPKHYPDPTAPERHERLCSICHHDDRDAIEQAFLQWRRPGDIRQEFNLPHRSTIYRHAHAFGLFEQRARDVRFVLEKVMEESTLRAPTAESMVRAVRAYSCLDDRGRWVEPPRRLIISREPYPPPSPLPPGREISVAPDKIEGEN